MDIGAGLITIIGALSAVYVSDRPYCYRAIVLGGIVLALTASACLGAWTHGHAILVIPVLVDTGESRQSDCFGLGERTRSLGV